jgi:hypothetical protein
MEFLKTTADLLTFQMVSDEFDREEKDRRMNGGISVYSIMDKPAGFTSGGSTAAMLPLGTLRDTYIPIGLYLDESRPKNEVEFIYPDCDHGVIDDDLYDKLMERISHKKYSTNTGKTLRIKSIKSKKTQKNI